MCLWTRSRHTIGERRPASPMVAIWEGRDKTNLGEPLHAGSPRNVCTCGCAATSRVSPARLDVRAWSAEDVLSGVVWDARSSGPPRPDSPISATTAHAKRQLPHTKAWILGLV